MVGAFSKILHRCFAYAFIGFLSMQALAADDYGGFDDDFDSSSSTSTIFVDPGPSVVFPDDGPIWSGPNDYGPNDYGPWDDGYYYDYMPAPSGVGVVIIPGTSHRGSKVGHHRPKAPKIGGGSSNSNPSRNRSRARSDASAVAPALIPIILYIIAPQGY